MRVLLIAGYMPWPENRGAACGLLYWLIKDRPADVELTIHSFNFNKIPNDDVKWLEHDLGCAIDTIPLSCRNKFLHGASLLTKLFIWLARYPHNSYFNVPKYVKEDIEEGGYDAIWIYPHAFYRLAYEFPDKKFVITGMDCESWNKLTRMSDPVFMKSTVNNLHQWVYRQQDIRMERQMNRSNILYHLVGMPDLTFYERLTNANNGVFLLHPHYKSLPRKIKFSDGEINVLFAGAYNFFVKTDVDFMVKDFLKQKHLQEKIHITFLGKNWDSVSSELSIAGYDCEIKTWVDDYAEELMKHDVQITPITNGGGTKGKVLDAISNGLLVISSQMAALNIAVRDKDSILIYKYPEQISAMLTSIYNDKPRFERIAEKGREQVLKFHSPKRCSERFFGVVKQWIDKEAK